MEKVDKNRACRLTLVGKREDSSCFAPRLTLSCKHLIEGVIAVSSLRWLVPHPQSEPNWQPSVNEEEEMMWSCVCVRVGGVGGGEGSVAQVGGSAHPRHARGGKKGEGRVKEEWIARLEDGGKKQGGPSRMCGHEIERVQCMNESEYVCVWRRSSCRRVFHPARRWLTEKGGKTQRRGGTGQIDLRAGGGK
eukprot:330900-Rhodomonas_salina.1